jgi:hypothetical protein
MRMGGSSSVIRRPAAVGDPTHALFADQSHSIPDNLVALLGAIRAWHCSPKLRLVLGRMQDQQLRFQITDAQTSAILTMGILRLRGRQNPSTNFPVDFSRTPYLLCVTRSGA